MMSSVTMRWGGVSSPQQGGHGLRDPSPDLGYVLSARTWLIMTIIVATPANSSWELTVGQVFAEHFARYFDVIFTDGSLERLRKLLKVTQQAILG